MEQGQWGGTARGKLPETLALIYDGSICSSPVLKPAFGLFSPEKTASLHLLWTSEAQRLKTRWHYLKWITWGWYSLLHGQNLINRSLRGVICQRGCHFKVGSEFTSRRERVETDKCWEFQHRSFFGARLPSGAVVYFRGQAAFLWSHINKIWLVSHYTLVA